ncbi:MAG: MipA/OmpV family protein [Burkholderiaceae bacterium]|jgi:outer membrane protein|nr:MipA/OmpV family protein [Burkholderiaceae bacterium]
MSCLISLSTEWWFSRGLSSAVLSLSVFSVAYAQTEPDVEGVQKPLWEAGLAGFGLTGPAYPGAEDDVGRALALPWFIYRGPVWRAAGGTIGARVAKNAFAEFDIGLGGALRASSEDVNVREGMPDLGFLLEFGPRAKLNLARPSQESAVRLELPLRGVFEFNSGVYYRGLAFEPKLTYDNRDLGRGWGFSGSVGLIYGDQTFNQYLYGVPSQYATTSRSAYTAKAGLITPRAQLTLSHKLNEDVRMFAFTRTDFAGKGVNSSSPLHLQDQGTSVGAGLIWTLGRSSQMVSD